MAPCWGRRSHRGTLISANRTLIKTKKPEQWPRHRIRVRSVSMRGPAFLNENFVTLLAERQRIESQQAPSVCRPQSQKASALDRDGIRSVPATFKPLLPNAL